MKQRKIHGNFNKKYKCVIIITKEVEASDFSPVVIEKCEKKAKENGYNSLTITTMETTTGDNYAEIVLDYKYVVPLLDQIMDHTITGYAR